MAKSIKEMLDKIVEEISKMKYPKELVEDDLEELKDEEINESDEEW